MVPVSMGLLVGELQSGRMRIIAVSSPTRMTGPFAQVPTWREQGADAVVSVWRGAFGAKGLTPAQISYWEGIFQKLMATPEWRQEIESAYGVSEFMGSAKTRQYMEREHAAEKAFLTDLGLAKR